MKDRKKAPEFRTLENISIIKAEPSSLDNGIPVHTINAGSQEVVKIELIFPGGLKNQPAPLVASGTNDMLDEGTENYSAIALAGAFDYFGAFIETEATQDFSTVSLYCMNNHLEKTMPLLAEMVIRPLFPDNEFSTWLTNKKQKFLVEEEKVASVCRKNFNARLFGMNHPYGTFAHIEDFAKISPADLKAFHKKSYNSDQCTIIASGKIPGELTALLNKYFGGDNWKGTGETFGEIPAPFGEKGKKEVIAKTDAIQSAIRVGKILFNKTHPDYFGLVVLNTVLGGYFGSRLMANIREDKGFTYGIGSGIVSLHDAGYFFIATEVGVGVCAAATDEIYKEVIRLRNEKVGEEELTLVKNYILGTFLRSVDGPFALADKFKSLLGYGLDYTFYDNFISSVKKADADQLINLANEYLNPDSMTELVVGKKQV